MRELPGGYSLDRRVDLRSDKKALLLSEGGQIVLLLLLGLLGLIFLPSVVITRKALLIQAAVLCLGLVCGLLLHEGLHGLLMRLGGSSRIRLGFIGLRPYMQCSACFDRRSYRRILLLPALLGEILLLAAVILVPADWKWTLYILLIGNTAAGWEDISLLLMTRSGGAEALYQHRGTVAEVYRKA